VAGFPQWLPRFDPRLGDLGYVVDKVVLEQVPFEYFGFPGQLSCHRLPHINRSLLAAGTTDQMMAELPGECGLTEPSEIIKRTFSDVIKLYFSFKTKTQI
jgi:hypothetical protein